MNATCRILIHATWGATFIYPVLTLVRHNGRLYWECPIMVYRGDFLEKPDLPFLGNFYQAGRPMRKWMTWGSRPLHSTWVQFSKDGALHLPYSPKHLELP